MNEKSVWKQLAPKDPNDWIKILGTTDDGSGIESKTIISMFGKLDPTDTKEVFEDAGFGIVKPLLSYWDETNDWTVNLVELNNVYDDKETLVQHIANAWERWDTKHES